MEQHPHQNWTLEQVPRSQQGSEELAWPPQDDLGVSILHHLATLFVMMGTREQSHPVTLYKACIKIIDKKNILGIVQSPSTSP